ncbi:UBIQUITINATION FACTOR E4 [Salix purpurea]|uniref:UBIQUITINATION FACTOR E4 n=1 Tax=Salix purpurea TaxID=77065 RepID=A0A9Q0TU82_SALPP|nr:UBIQUITINATION FACTOR E4 [Salix purpurea]
MNFIIMFMASPTYIRNPYLRAKMVEVLNCWMPRGRNLFGSASMGNVSGRTVPCLRSLPCQKSKLGL